MLICEHCNQKNQLKTHTQSCPKAPRECPLSHLGCTQPATSEGELQQHMEGKMIEHLGIIAKTVQSLEKKFEQRESTNPSYFLYRVKNVVIAKNSIPPLMNNLEMVDPSIFGDWRNN
jgi:hypothetical protein